MSNKLKHTTLIIQGALKNNNGLFWSYWDIIHYLIKTFIIMKKKQLFNADIQENVHKNVTTRKLHTNKLSNKCGIKVKHKINLIST